MSYASANQNHENRFDLSEAFLNKTWKNLNESLDTKERVLPDRRRVNIDEAERVIRALPQEVLQQEVIDDLLDYWRYVSNNAYDVIMKMGMHKMQEVLQRDFINVWDSMYFYMYMSDSFQLSQMLSNSANMSEEKPWRAVLQLRLEEKLIVSKRALHNLARVHVAYCNAVPLVNNMVTPNGSYDSLYLNEELFPKTTKINQTYTRLRRHFKKYMENIDWLFRNYIADAPVVEIILHCNEFFEASVEYYKDIRLYESFVIRHPLQRIIHEKNKINQTQQKDDDAKTRLKDEINIYVRYIYYLNRQWREYSRSYATDTIATYLDNLKNETHVSKLSLAAAFTSDKTIKQLDKYQDSVKSLKEHFNIIETALEDIRWAKCQYYHIMKEPLLAAWFAKQYGHYNRSSVYEKAAMKSYFMPNVNSSIYISILRNPDDLKWKCIFELKNLKTPYNFELVSLTQLTAFQNNLESFLQKSRLEGAFFRYVSVIQTIKHLLTTTHSNIHNYRSF